MYKWSPYYRRYYRTRYPYYYRYNTYRCSPYYYPYSTYSKCWPYRYRWSPRLYRYLTDKYYNYRYSPYYRKYYFDDLYVDLKTKMDMFRTFLDSVPKNRSQMVNDLEIPEDVLKNRPYRTEVDEDLSSIGSEDSVYTLGDLKPRPRSPASTDSSLSLSKALTASEIDYEMFRKFKNRRRSDPFYEMRNAIEAFPEEYLMSTYDYQKTEKKAEEPITSTSKRERPLHNDTLIRRMERYFDVECNVFAPDDPGLLDLEEALDSIDLKTLDLDRI